MYRLTSFQTLELLNQPESGMGYQRVDVVLADGRELLDRVVFNAEEIDLPDDVTSNEIVEIRLRTEN